MGYPFFKTAAIQPDEKTSTIKRNAWIQAPTDFGQFCHLLYRLSFGPLERKDGAYLGPVVNVHYVAIMAHIILWSH